ncbi:hypothetical protein [Piscirickettsia salmonis]|uniref:hypothetical protein n=1 Tax=Piscirickettsia salmonis TaxID=1238 RepID=UPI0002F5286A|nr:hypothetical protein [Piscirickettsia salmonis]APS56887.1 hypothetical protein AVI52_06280 [Piscirickettsia salmonis]ERL62601.1 hypothetical protein K661_01038 [Piscirickettsia salmonis LF-89 = ATCC VR-1361]PEQ16807.1 hypothetical protein X973_05485 [Piscirickettsia salmonis]QGN78254.1 hypothetical protein Psal001_02490 [Piscirickettsia salmonis]QGN81835.1 hypothetical protein Psal002_02506 [Piscirickettsia salmonis]
MKQKKKTCKDLKAVLLEMDTTQLCGVLQDLYKFSSENKAFFHSRFLADQRNYDHLMPYKARIRNAICPKEPWKYEVQLSIGRKAISEFKKANGNLRDTVSLMLYYVSCGNDFILEFGDIDERFYDSMGSMFARLVNTLVKHKDRALAAEFMPQLEREVKRVAWTGWGYGDELAASLSDLQKVFPVYCGKVI